MINPELVDYIKKARMAGKTDKDISDTLLKLGWGQVDVADSIKAVTPNPTEWLKDNWKVLVAWVLIVVLVLIIIGMVYMIFTTPPQK